MSPPESPIERRGALAPGPAAEVLALAEAATGADGIHPLDEHVALGLRHGDDHGAVHLLAREPAPGRGLIGYAHLDPGGPGRDATAELVVRPEVRGRGVGRRLAGALVRAADPAAGRLRVWAHGDHPAARALAGRLGFHRDRVLLRLRRGLAGPLPDPVLPAGVRLRAFRPGRDEAAWLAVNARAFAGHPEQGRWTGSDLRLRMAEPWFDPAGFLLAVRGEELLGFHWTKIHAGPPEPIGEVYVVGVDPAAQGLRLGTALTVAGLRHLRERGLAEVMLYVDGSNAAALALYTRLGFSRWTADVMYSGPAAGPAAGPAGSPPGGDREQLGEA